MPFSSQSFSSGQEITTTHLNQFNENDVWLFGRFLPILTAGRVCVDNLAFYIVSFDNYDANSNLIVLANNSGTGRWGASWSKINVGGKWAHIQITIPSGIFSSKVWVLGHSIGSASSWAMTACAHWDETTTGYKLAIWDVGTSNINESAGFAYTALLAGIRGGTIS
jgi:hypothetical protein